jgi:hypothetical protein
MHEHAEAALPEPAHTAGALPRVGIADAAKAPGEICHQSLIQGLRIQNRLSSLDIPVINEASVEIALIGLPVELLLFGICNLHVTFRPGFATMF